MNPATMWVLAASALVVVEMFTMEFTCLCLALGALGAAITAALGLPLAAQLGVAFAGAVAGLFGLRPFMRSRFTPRDTATATDLIVGSEAVVIEAIEPHRPGKVKLDGAIWNAESDQTVPEGARVVVTDLEGTRLRVLSRAALAPRALPLDDLTRN